MFAHLKSWEHFILRISFCRVFATNLLLAMFLTHVYSLWIFVFESDNFWWYLRVWAVKVQCTNLEHIELVQDMVIRKDGTSHDHCSLIWLQISTVITATGSGDSIAYLVVEIDCINSVRSLVIDSRLHSSSLQPIINVEDAWFQWGKVGSVPGTIKKLKFKNSEVNKYPNIFISGSLIIRRKKSFLNIFQDRW